jgi:hypothetical protein
MWKKIAIAGATAAVIGGAGTAALAESGSSTPAATPAATAASTTSTTSATSAAATGGAKPAAKHPGLAKLRKLQHGTWVTGDGSNDVTHDIIKGKVSAVSPTSVTVKSSDTTTQTYAVTSTTKVHTRAKHQGAAITDVKAGDAVVVTGTANGGSLTATQVVDAAK